MTIKLTDRELSLLADLVYAGNWLINGWRLPCGIIKPYKEISDGIFNLLVKNKVKRKSKKEREKEAYRDVEDEVYNRIESYRESLTDKAALSRFAELLAKYQYGEERYFERSEAVDSYHEELDRHYLKNVRIEIQKDT